jgi:hypothetical protein
MLRWIETVFNAVATPVPTLTEILNTVNVPVRPTPEFPRSPIASQNTSYGTKDSKEINI